MAFNQGKSDLASSDEQLARTTFAPEHIEHGKLLPTAISSQDLKQRGFSVDRCTLLRISVVESRLEKQAARNANRDERFVSLLEVADLIEMQLVLDGERAFSVFAEPIRGNAAHACIYSAREGRTKSQIKALKKLLIPIIENDLFAFEKLGARLKEMRARKGPLNRARRAFAHFASLKNQT